jgi:hypothetical protein
MRPNVTVVEISWFYVPSEAMAYVHTHYANEIDEAITKLISKKKIRRED